MKAINHKNGNPRKNNLDNLEVISIENIFTEVTEEEKEKLLQHKPINVNNTIHEDDGKDFE